MSSARLCTFPWASRRPQQRLTRSSILSIAPINSGSFPRDGDKISLKRLRARPAVYGPHLLCNLRQLLKPWSPPADITTSKLSPSVSADSTVKSCPSICVDISASSSGTPSATAVDVTASGDSTTNDKAPRTFGNTPTRSSRPSWPTRRSLLLCPRTLVAFPSLSGQQASFSSVLVHDSTPS